MSTDNTIKASIVDEGASGIERLAVKITRFLNSNTDNFIKTFPFVTHPKNSSILSLIKDELPPYKRISYFGIGLTSYKHVSYINFISTFSAFKLNKGDKVTFYLANGNIMIFNLEHENKKEGYAYRNVHPITDSELDVLGKVSLAYWKVTNTERNISMVGGFSYQDHNKQYKTERTGQRLLRIMAKSILTVKKELELLCLLAAFVNPLINMVEL